MEEPSLDQVTTQMVRVAEASCLAGSLIKDKAAFGGFAESSNLPKPNDNLISFERGKVQLIAEPNHLTRTGMRLLLINDSESTLVLKACDSKLFLIQEAKCNDGSGEWIPIESFPKSDCGNSFHRVYLASGEHWEFSVPRYTGSVKTKLRFRLKAPELVSNEFSGSVGENLFRRTRRKHSSDSDEGGDYFK